MRRAFALALKSTGAAHARRSLVHPVRMGRLSGLHTSTLAGSTAGDPSESVLVLNAGSSSLKYKLIRLREGTHFMYEHETLVSGMAERIGESEAGQVKVSVHAPLSAGGGRESKTTQTLTVKLDNHEHALRLVLDELAAAGVDAPTTIGHRVVHGGKLTASRVLDDATVKVIEDAVNLAPLHNPPNLAGIYATKSLFPDTPQVAVFDTAFHQTMPEHAYTYPIPLHYRSKWGIRRYGFHGTSHHFVCEAAADYVGKPLEECNFITAHLGNGASVAAVQSGRVVDTSMGLTPLEGLMMGTRSGDVDPAIVSTLARCEGIDVDEVLRVLNKESGLKAIGGSNDMRDILKGVERDEPMAALALEMYASRVRKYIGAYAVGLDGPIDAVIFTAGVGENSALVRSKICQGLDRIDSNLVVSSKRNSKPDINQRLVRQIQSCREPLRPKLLVVRTNEELQIAIECVRNVRGWDLVHPDLDTLLHEYLHEEDDDDDDLP